MYESNIALTEKLIADINTKQQQGMALKNDVTRYELQMEQLKLGKRKLEDQKRILNHQLCNTLGLEGVMVEPEVDLDRIGDAGIKEADLQNTAAMQSPVIRQSAPDAGIRPAAEARQERDDAKVGSRGVGEFHGRTAPPATGVARVQLCRVVYSLHVVSA